VDYLQIANSSGMWIAASAVVLIVIFQAVVFMRKAYSTGLKMGITPQQMKKGMRAGLITAIGPSLAVAFTMLSLMIPMGAPFAWMRLSVVGAVPYELMAASAGARVMGVELGGAGYGVTAWAISMWTTTIAAGGWLILCALFIPKFDSLRKKVVRGRTEFLPILTVCFFMGALAFFGLPYFVAGGAHLVAAATGGVTMLVVGASAKKLPWLKEWALGIAMVVGVLATIPFIT
jgi:hypothetical protein